jgi:hypothetical protein
LDDRVLALLINIRDDFNRMMPAVAVLQGQIVITNRAFCLQFLHCDLIRIFIAEDADFLQFLADEIIARVIEQFHEKWIDVRDHVSLHVDHQDAIVCRFEQSTKTNL